jgi:hypothetical protein
MRLSLGGNLRASFKSMSSEVYVQDSASLDARRTLQALLKPISVKAASLRVHRLKKSARPSNDELSPTGITN